MRRKLIKFNIDSKEANQIRDEKIEEGNKSFPILATFEGRCDDGEHGGCAILLRDDDVLFHRFEEDDVFGKKNKLISFIGIRTCR